MKQSVDYHLHTYYSDGKDSPTDVVKWAKEQGLDTIAITDHDGVGGIMEATIAGKALDITVVPGIELSTLAEEGMGLHILGYHIDPDNQALLDSCQEIKQLRQERNEKYLAALAEEGYPLTLAELTFRKGQDFIGKPMIARAMVNKGYIQETGDAFSGIFATEKLRAIKKKKISEKEAIKLILDAGGIPVLAHPALIRGLGQRETAEFYAHLDCLLGRLKKLGLKGIECYYPQHSEEEQLAFVHLAEKYHLHITTGSDYHGEGVHK